MIWSRRYGVRALAALAVTTAAAVGGTLPASADTNPGNSDVNAEVKAEVKKLFGGIDHPSDAQILDYCQKVVTDKPDHLYCTFDNPVVDKAYLGNYHPASDDLYNYTSSDATQQLNWSDTVGSTNTVEVSASVTATLIDKVLSASVSAKYGYTWSNSHSEGGSIGITVKPGEVGWIDRAQAMHKVTGTWHFYSDGLVINEQVKGTIVSPADNGTDGVRNAVVAKTRKMTANEKGSSDARLGKVLTKPHVSQG
ncbi:hypothetical protein [Streptomyces luteireticuli]|uniref:hypothetical protein n=1 Tax=Streptomyces luteireticuli TaxID=173858 RepID=UPI00355846AE